MPLVDVSNGIFDMSHPKFENKLKFYKSLTIGQHGLINKNHKKWKNKCKYDLKIFWLITTILQTIRLNLVYNNWIILMRK